MKERPILFSAPMVRAILAGTKTQTRRIVRLPDDVGEVYIDPGGTDVYGPGPYVKAYPRDHREPMHRRIRCPYGYPGDRLWVRETWCRASDDAIGYADPLGSDGRPLGPPYRPDPESDTVLRPWVFYRATDEHVVNANDEDRSPWKPSIHMPRWASRITLEVTSVRVERLHDISEADCWAEGLEEVDGMLDDVEICRLAKAIGCSYEDARPSFAALWEHAHGAGSWDVNPWVWVVTFKETP